VKLEYRFLWRCNDLQSSPWAEKCEVVLFCAVIMRQKTQEALESAINRAFLFLALADGFHDSN